MKIFKCISYISIKYYLFIFVGLPTRDYFIQENNKVYLDAYKEYLIKISLLLGGELEHVKVSAEKLIDFEIK